jgi:hypothetical protein
VLARTSRKLLHCTAGDITIWLWVLWEPELRMSVLLNSNRNLPETAIFKSRGGTRSTRK